MLRSVKEKRFYLAAAAISFLLMFHYASAQGLWNDEIGRYTYSMGTLSETIGHCIRMEDLSPPLFPLAAFLWQKLPLPYGEQWLLLLSILPTVIAVVTVGAAGETLAGKWGGWTATALTGFSATVWGYCAFDYGPYSFTLMFSALSIYSQIKKNQQPEKTGWPALYSVSLLGLAMSHYFGMMACGLLFLGDAVWPFKKRSSVRSFAPYLLPGIASLAWLAAVYFGTLRFRSTAEIASWYSVPSVAGIQDLLRFLTGRLDLTYWLLFIGFGFCAARLLGKSRGSLELHGYYQWFLGMAILTTVLLMYVYGKCINRESTMWQQRYFVFLIPWIVLLSVTALSDLCAGPGKSEFRYCAIGAFLSISVLLNCLNMAKSCSVSQPFREAADWLYAQSDRSFRQDTIVVTTMGYVAGYSDYYMTQQGRREPINVINQYSLNREKLSGYSTVFLQYTHLEPADWLKEVLADDFILLEDHNDIQIREYIRKPS